MLEKDIGAREEGRASVREGEREAREEGNKIDLYNNEVAML